MISTQVEACDGARLFARWSGPALLAPPFRRVGPGVFEAAVDAPVAGDYALEVLHFGCGWELGDAADFQARCLPVPAAVHEPYVAALPATAAGAFWLAGGPRPTRFQRPDCVVAPKKDDGSAKPRPVHTPRCAAETSRDWYNGTFARRAFPGGGPDPDVAGWPGACGLDRGRNLSRVCFVGASHARKLVWAAERLARRARVRNGTLRLEKRATDFKHVDAQFPGDYFKHDLASCGFVVVALGQWAAGWPGGAPTGATAWAAELRPVIEDLARLRDGGATVALRSIDHIPLGYKQLQCPPTDWRTPFLIDAYNDELRALAAAAAVPFLDTTAVARPIWDLASDWNHLDFGASDAQAAAILVELCGGRG